MGCVTIEGSASQEACASQVGRRSIHLIFGETRTQIWEQGVAGSNPVAPTSERMNSGMRTASSPGLHCGPLALRPTS